MVETRTSSRGGEYWRLRMLLCALLLAGCGALPLPATPPPTASPSDQIIATPISSAGCGQPAPAPLGRSVSQTLSSGGWRREYRLHLPPAYQATAGTVMVLNFHGHGSNASEQEYLSGLSIVADQHQFIAVYPQGLRGPDGQTGWATTESRAARVNDVLFVSDLLNHLQAHLCIDPQRIYATGFSNGGGMTNLLACSMAGRLAAFAPVSGSYPPYPGGCHPVRPVPLLEIHGTADRVVPYDGRAELDYPPILTWLQDWAARDGCTNGPTTFYQHANVTGRQWTGCQDDAQVVHYRIGGEGHVWPANIFVEPGGAAEQTMSASLLIWLFFQPHALPGTGADGALRAAAARYHG